MTRTYKWPWRLITALLVGCVAIYLSSPWRATPVPAEVFSEQKFNGTGLPAICVDLAAALPNHVYSAQHKTYHDFRKKYWSNNAAEIEPGCIVQPSNTQQVAQAVRILRQGYDEGQTVTFAVRSGGHSPEAGFSSINGGVVIDLQLINEVTVSEDEASAVIGVGARWLDVSSKLDDRGLALVGGRNANVGVGGLILGGGVSFFSPRFGMVCDNIYSYEIVLANGSIIVATAHEYADLWRALKGGTGNFGIVTRATTKVFPAGKIWAGYAYWTDWQTSQALRVFHEFNKVENFDAYAGGPILALAYVSDVGLRITTSSISYTKPEPWPAVFNGFKSNWRVWSTLKVQSLSAATQELDKLAPTGQRQFQVTTTIKNDLQTFQTFNDIYTKTLKTSRHPKGAIWSLIFQPLSAAVTRKGSPNVLGLETRHANDTLIIVLVSVSWKLAEDDVLVHEIARDIIHKGEEYAQEKGTADPYIYLNYAASGQKVFEGCGEDNVKFLREVGRIYDPERFFQVAKHGGFKLI